MLSRWHDPRRFRDRIAKIDRSRPDRGRSFGLVCTFEGGFNAKNELACGRARAARRDEFSN